MIINLLSSPRNVSTAMMYAFHHRGDTHVFDEPYYGYYLHTSGADHPGKEEIIANMELEPGKIDEAINDAATDQHVFVKNMAHHYLEFDLPLAGDFIHLFLLRDPALIINSFSKVIHAPTMTDIGVKRQFELWEFAKKHGLKFLLMDSSDLLIDPARNMPILCKHLGLDFRPEMVKWPTGSIPQDGVWAKFWYDSVHQSGGFKATPRRTAEPSAQHQALLEEAQHYYQMLSKDKIIF